MARTIDREKMMGRSTMGQVHFVIGHRTQIDGLDGVGFTGTKDGATLRFAITREALEALAEGASHSSTLLEMFDGWKERIWGLAERKAAQGLLYVDGRYLITEDDVTNNPDIA